MLCKAASSAHQRLWTSEQRSSLCYTTDAMSSPPNTGPTGASSAGPDRLTADEVRRVAKLCRVGLTDDEVEQLRGEMASLLAEVSVLQAIDTDGVEPTGHAVEGVHTVMRDDVPIEPMTVEDVLANAPQREGDYFRVRAVMEYRTTER